MKKLLLITALILICQVLICQQIKDTANLIDYAVFITNESSIDTTFMEIIYADTANPETGEIFIKYAKGIHVRSGTGWFDPNAKDELFILVNNKYVLIDPEKIWVIKWK